MISTKGRYALRIMIDLAEHRGGDWIPLKAVAERQEISQKYIERIMPSLTGAGLVEGLHGKGGGYRLTRSPEEYTALQVLTAAEGELAPVACLGNGAPACSRASECRWWHLGGCVFHGSVAAAAGGAGARSVKALAARPLAGPTRPAG